MRVAGRPTAGDHGLFTAEDAEDAEATQSGGVGAAVPALNKAG